MFRISIYNYREIFYWLMSHALVRFLDEAPAFPSPPPFFLIPLRSPLPLIPFPRRLPLPLQDGYSKP